MEQSDEPQRRTDGTEGPSVERFRVFANVAQVQLYAVLDALNDPLSRTPVLAMLCFR